MYCKSHSKYTLCFLLQIIVKLCYKFTVQTYDTLLPKKKKNYNTLSIHHIDNVPLFYKS